MISKVAFWPWYFHSHEYFKMKRLIYSIAYHLSFSFEYFYLCGYLTRSNKWVFNFTTFIVSDNGVEEGQCFNKVWTRDL